MNRVMPEHRSSERVPAGLVGWFASETNGDPVACTVWDLSEKGARLVIPAPADVPLKFQSRIPHEGAVARVRLVWTAGSQYGVKFTD
jgi:hypothetical protein